VVSLSLGAARPAEGRTERPRAAAPCESGTWLTVSAAAPITSASAADIRWPWYGSPVIARLLPAAVLSLVAVAQILLAQRGGLTPWKGGGFGMFSTLDHGAHRRVEIVIEAPDRSEALEIPPSLDELAARTTAYPSDRLLRQLAERVVSREQRSNRAVSRVRLSVWRTDFDPVTLTASEQPLRSFVYDVR
jgi:hypothetical protein